MKPKVKTIVLKRDGEVVHEFNVYDVELKLAKKLGISERDFIIEKSKVELEELKNDTSNR
jgi:hypothetical protein